MEYSNIWLNFNDNLKLEQIPDDVIIKMLDNVEDRIFGVGFNGDFIIIRRISDNKIHKSEITYEYGRFGRITTNQEEIE